MRITFCAKCGTTNPAIRALKVSFLSAFLSPISPLAKLSCHYGDENCSLFSSLFVEIKVCFETCLIQFIFIMIVDVGTIRFQLKSKVTVVASIQSWRSRPYAKSQPLVTFRDAHNTDIAVVSQIRGAK